MDKHFFLKNLFFSKKTWTLVLFTIFLNAWTGFIFINIFWLNKHFLNLWTFFKLGNKTKKTNIYYYYCEHFLKLYGHFFSDSRMFWIHDHFLKKNMKMILFPGRLYQNLIFLIFCEQFCKPTTFLNPWSFYDFPAHYTKTWFYGFMNIFFKLANLKILN